MATKNTLGDMHNIMFEELERLMDCEPGSDEQKAEIARAQAVSNMCKQITANATTIMRASQISNKHVGVPRILMDGNDNADE